MTFLFSFFLFFFFFTDAVVQQHPGAKIPDIRTAINKRICELRHQEKKKSMTEGLN